MGFEPGIFRFLLGGTLNEHYHDYNQKYQNFIETIKNDMYADNLVSAGDMLSEVEKT